MQILEKLRSVAKNIISGRNRTPLSPEEKALNTQIAEWNAHYMSEDSPHRKTYKSLLEQVDRNMKARNREAALNANDEWIKMQESYLRATQFLLDTYLAYCQKHSDYHCDTSKGSSIDMLSQEIKNGKAVLEKARRIQKGEWRFPDPASPSSSKRHAPRTSHRTNRL